MSPGHRIGAAVLLALLAVTWLASVYGWGLRSTAVADARIREKRRSVRTGSSGYRPYGGGGPRYGK